MKPNIFVRELYDRRASDYERWASSFWETYHRSVNREVVRLLVHENKGNKPIDLLDMGCGPGHRLQTILDECGWDRFRMIVASDGSWKMIKQSQALLQASSVALVQADLEALPFGEGCFDVILMLYAVLGCLSKEKARQNALHECHRLLRKGGRLILDVLSRGHFFYQARPEVFEDAKFFKQARGWNWSSGDILLEEEKGSLILNHGFDRAELAGLSFPLFSKVVWKNLSTETGQESDERDGHFFGVLEK